MQQFTHVRTNWINKSYAYDDDAHKHAVTSVTVTDENLSQTTNTYVYDRNGNMTCRDEGGVTYLQDYNSENRIMGVALVDGDCDTLPAIDDIRLWAFTYDGDGCGLCTPERFVREGDQGQTGTYSGYQHLNNLLRGFRALFFRATREVRTKSRPTAPRIPCASNTRRELRGLCALFFRVRP